MRPRCHLHGLEALIAAPLLLAALASSTARAFTVEVKTEGPNGTLVPIQAGFRYLIEEDNSFHATPGVATPSAPWPDPSNTLAVNIHKSHAPVVCTGDTQTLSAGPLRWASSVDTATNPDCKIDPARRYMVTVLPWHVDPLFYPAKQPNGPWFANQSGYTLSGRNVAPGQQVVEVVVHAFPVPTSQITVLVFMDSQPINGAYDQPAEQGLGGFNLLLTDIVGKMMQDAWGNPVGTSYQVLRETPPGCTGPAGYCKPLKGPGGAYRFVTDPLTGLPVIDYTGNGTLTTCPTGDPAYDAANCTDLDTGAPLTPGEAVIRFLAPNKYTIEPIPPAKDPDWLLTATLEGTRGNDAWVRAAEPRFNITLGQLNYLVFYGFVKKMPMTLPSRTGARGTLKGQVVFAHDMHPPLSPGLAVGAPVPNCYVGLNNLSGADEQVFTAPCNADSTFSIANIPPGLYQLVTWDQDIDAIIDFRNVTIPPAGGVVDLGQVAVYRWFGSLRGSVFFDANANALREPSEQGIANMRVNARFTDGSLYASQLTDANGDYSFAQFFPWWRWVSVETDTSRFRSTGATSVADDGGPVPPGPWAKWGINPQLQPGGLPYRTQASTPGAEVRSQAMLLFSDMTNVIDWGKGNYAPNANGGIRGFVSYATSRTQEDPEKGRWQSWEPGVPRVQVNLYNAVADANGKWVPATCSGGSCTACSAACAPINSTFTDSWDDNNPSGCVGQPGTPWAAPQAVNGIPIRSCAETFQTWDQVRPGVFDGAYSFDSYCQGAVTASYPNVSCAGTVVPTLPPGNYIVQVIPPTGYKVLKWGERNIEFGEPNAAFQMYPARCVGPDYPVPQFHQLFPDWQIPTPYPAPNSWYCGGTVDAFGYCNPASAGPMAPSCSMKLTDVAQDKNSVVDFRIFTDVPKSSRIWGWVSDDLHLESNPKSPNASSNFAPSWLPVAIKDWKGTEVARFYTDQWGKFDGLIPSTYTIYTPNPLGMSAGLYTIAPNDPGPIVDSNPSSPTYGQRISDPWFNPAYGQEVIRENWDFYAGKTTFVDTIVLPVAGFVENRIPLNCDFVDHTPEIAWVNFNGRGPLVPSGGGYQITIQSVGQLQVPNPDFNPNLPATTAGCSASPPPAGSNCSTIVRDHSFGPDDGHGQVTVGGVALTNLAWTATTIQATVPANVVTSELVVSRTNPNNAGAPLTSTVGVTLHVDQPSVPVVQVAPPPANCDPYTDATKCMRIQPAVDSAPNGALILIGPGKYEENVILYKPVKLQGWGAASTILDGTAALGNLPMKEAWRTAFQTLVANGGSCGTTPCIDIPPGQVNNSVFETGAGIMVSGCDPSQHGGSCANQFTAAAGALVDGLTITGASESGGGIYVNSYAPNLQVSNNEIYGNQGSLSGGIRLGTSSLLNGAAYSSSHNESARIHHNRVAVNGSLQAGGGGISLYKGSDNYQVQANLVCGNLSINYGGGISHYGLSPNGLIAHNVVVSNESINEGGGIFVGGELPPNTAAAGTLSEGAGSVNLIDNLIQGNKAGDDGGGVRTLMFNGQDVANSRRDPSKWFRLNLFDNIVVDNSSADHGGGLSFDDTVLANITHNTIARNDSTATGSGAFGGPCVEGAPPGQICPPPGEAIGGLANSIPRVGGIASYAHSTGLAAALAGANIPPTLKVFTHPLLLNNIIWQNRSFYWDAAYCNGFGGLRPDVQGLCGPAEPPVFWDLAVYGAAPTTRMIVQNGVLTPDATNRANYSGFGNVFADPLFVRPYFDLYQASSKGAAFGNYVTATFVPNGLMSAADLLYGDYHLKAGSPAIGRGATRTPRNAISFSALLSGNPFLNALQQLQAANLPLSTRWPELSRDYDNQRRPTGTRVDIGADQYYPAEVWFPW